MRKMKLDVEAVTVESFRTTGEGTEVRGTVRAHGLQDLITRITCEGYTCDYQTGSPCAAC